MESFANRIDATAIVSPEAEIAGDTHVGAFVIIEGKVRIGSRCVIRPHAHLVGPLVIGNGNQISTGATLGEFPQHASHLGETTAVEIGDDNLLGEQVTVHRGITQVTRIGSRNVFMANSHVGHDSQIGDMCFLDNNALIGGHCVIEDSVYLSGNSAVHQFVRLGRLSFLGIGSVMTKDLLPFAMSQNTNIVSGVNVEGMKRAGLSDADVEAALRAFEILYQEKNTVSSAVARIEEELPGSAIAQELIAFTRNSKRGIVLGNRYGPTSA